MDKFKRVCALLGVILLVLMYAMTLVTAITATDTGHNWFAASIAATIIVPVFLYGINLFVKVANQNRENDRMREEMYLHQMKEALKQKQEKEAGAQNQAAENMMAGTPMQAAGTPMQVAGKMAAGMQIQDEGLSGDTLQ